jgi:hypothetical protein
MYDFAAFGPSHLLNFGNNFSSIPVENDALPAELSIAFQSLGKGGSVPISTHDPSVLYVGTPQNEPPRVGGCGFKLHSITTFGEVRCVSQEIICVVEMVVDLG